MIYKGGGGGGWGNTIVKSNICFLTGAFLGHMKPLGAEPKGRLRRGVRTFPRDQIINNYIQPIAYLFSLFSPRFVLLVTFISFIGTQLPGSTTSEICVVTGGNVTTHDPLYRFPHQTTILAVTFDGGVVIGSDSRASMGG